MRWMARVAAVSGFGFGFLLVFSPEKIKRINQVLNQ